MPIPTRAVRFHALPGKSGILVTGIEKESPAEAAGLMQGDIILSFDDSPALTMDDLHRMLTEKKIGVASRLEILHGVERKKVFITPEDRETSLLKSSRN